MSAIVYKTIRVGNYVWTENLRETKYNTGADIYVATNNNEWKMKIDDPVEEKIGKVCTINDVPLGTNIGDDYDDAVWTQYDRQVGEGGDREDEEEEEEEDQEHWEDDGGQTGDLIDTGDVHVVPEYKIPIGQYGYLYNHYAVQSNSGLDRLSRNFTGHPTLPDQTGWMVPTLNSCIDWDNYMINNYGTSQYTKLGFHLKSSSPIKIFRSGRRMASIVGDIDWLNWANKKYYGGGADTWNFRALPAGFRIPFSGQIWWNYYPNRTIYRYFVGGNFYGQGRFAYFHTFDIVENFYCSPFGMANTIGSFTQHYYATIFRGYGFSVRLCRPAVAGDPPTGEFCQDYVGNP